MKKLNKTLVTLTMLMLPLIAMADEAHPLDGTWFQTHKKAEAAFLFFFLGIVLISIVGFFVKEKLDQKKQIKKG